MSVSMKLTPRPRTKEDDDDDIMNSDNIGSHDGEDRVLDYETDSSSEGA